MKTMLLLALFALTLSRVSCFDPGRECLAVLVIDSNASHYDALRAVWKHKRLQHPRVHAYFVRGDKSVSNTTLKGDTIYTDSEESYMKITEKTVKGYAYLLEHFRCPYILRTNISSFWVWVALLEWLRHHAKHTDHYSGVMGKAEWKDGMDGMGKAVGRATTFASGAGFIVSRNLAELMVSNQVELLELGTRVIDDVAIGEFLNTRRKIDITLMDRCDYTSRVETLPLNVSRPGCYHYRIYPPGQRHDVAPYLFSKLFFETYTPIAYRRHGQLLAPRLHDHTWV